MATASVSNRTDVVNYYECKVCEEGPFKSRSDWLFHLNNYRHSLKAREKLEQLKLKSQSSGNGNLFVVSGIGPFLDSSQLLDYIATKLDSFSNWICFKPEADISIIVCDPSELKTFSGSSHAFSNSLKFRNYDDLTIDEWKSFISQTRKNSEITEVLDPLLLQHCRRRKVRKPKNGRALESNKKVTGEGQTVKIPKKVVPAPPKWNKSKSNQIDHKRAGEPSKWSPPKDYGYPTRAVLKPKPSKWDSPKDYGYPTRAIVEPHQWNPPKPKPPEPQKKRKQPKKLRKAPEPREWDIIRVPTVNGQLNAPKITKF